MISIPANVKLAIRAHASRSEAVMVGLVLVDNVVLPLDNLLPKGDIADTDLKTKHNDYRFDISVFHSHSDQIVAMYCTKWRRDSSCLLSDTDILGAKALDVPIIQYHSGLELWDLWNPNGTNPFPLDTGSTDEKSLGYYLNRPWQFIRSDCFSLVRSYYQGMLDIDLSDDLTFNYGFNRIDFHGNGFKPFSSDSSLKQHDIIAYKLASGENCLGILTGVNPRQVLVHQKSREISRVVDFDQISNIEAVWRLSYQN